MKFLSVTLRNFGPLSGADRFDFSNGSHGLHLIYGPNEAGRARPCAGLRYFLFGFPVTKQRRFPFKDAAVSHSGEPAELERRYAGMCQAKGTEGNTAGRRRQGRHRR